MSARLSTPLLPTPLATNTVLGATVTPGLPPPLTRGAVGDWELDERLTATPSLEFRTSELLLPRPVKVMPVASPPTNWVNPALDPMKWVKGTELAWVRSWKVTLAAALPTAAVPRFSPLEIFALL